MGVKGEVLDREKTHTDTEKGLDVSIHKENIYWVNDKLTQTRYTSIVR